MTKDREGRGQNITNAQIITTDNGRIYKLKNLLNAISEIQQFYVIESKDRTFQLIISPLFPRMLGLYLLEVYRYSPKDDFARMTSSLFM